MRLLNLNKYVVNYESYFVYKILLCIRNSKIPKGQTEIVKSRTDKTMANKMKRKTNIEHTTLH